MLQINFLPVRQLKKREKAKNQLVAFFLAFATIVAVCAAFWWLQSHNLDVAEEQNRSLKQQVENESKTLATIDKLNQEKAELERKTKVIEQLKKESSLTVRVMDEVASRVDSARLWLNSMTETGANVELKGIALDNESIAQFMDSLKTSPFVRDVSLAESSQQSLAGRDLKSFSISCQVAPPGSESVTVDSKAKAQPLKNTMKR